MKLSDLTAISPIDGRYRQKTQSLDQYFSEYALIRYRVRVEIEYFITLSQQLNTLNIAPYADTLRNIYRNFSTADAQRVKEIEQTTNHDVKAVEYYIKEQFDHIGGELLQHKEYIHFGLTSQDINNTSIPLSLKEALTDVYIPMLEELIAQLDTYARQWADIPMLAKTHGQPASPTRLGKEIQVFAYRLSQQLDQLKACKITAKFGGATGNYNAHHVAYPTIDWQDFGDRFVSHTLGLERERWTTQISNYDNLAAICNAMARINTIIIDLDRDMWMYVSMEYFKQKIKAGEVGSSAMPHKVNPIDFENSEGNLGIANAILQHLATKLPISRLQRDLTDSTAIRNVGTAFAHSLIAVASTKKGLGKAEVRAERIAADLADNWEVLAEPIQTVMRKAGMDRPYERLKELTRGRRVTAQIMKDFVEGLDLPEEDKRRLAALTPATYIGKAAELALIN